MSYRRVVNLRLLQHEVPVIRAEDPRQRRHPRAQCQARLHVRSAMLDPDGADNRLDELPPPSPATGGPNEVVTLQQHEVIRAKDGIHSQCQAP